MNVWKKTISKIVLVMENCDEIHIPVTSIEELHMDTIQSEGCEKFCINDFAITIKKHFKYSRLLDHHDLCAVKIKYINGIENTYSLPYEDGGNNSLGAPNILQATNINQNGNLEIKILNT